MTRLDDLLRLASDTPAPPAGLIPAILQRIHDDAERRGVLRLLISSLFVAATLLITFDLSSRTVLELFGRKWLDLLGGFYEEPMLLLSREGSMALLEHLFHGNIPLLLIALLLFGLTIRRFWHAYSTLPTHFHASL